MILIRTTGDPAFTIADLRAAVEFVDPNLPPSQNHDHPRSNVQLHDARRTDLLADRPVVRRTNEIRLRIAFGAQTPTVQWMILSESLLLLAIGVGLGLPLTLLTTKYIKDQLFGLSALDPMTFTVALTVVSDDAFGGMAAGTPSNQG